MRRHTESTAEHRFVSLKDINERASTSCVSDEAWRTFFNEVSDSCTSLLFNVLRKSFPVLDFHKAQDIVQIALLKAWNSRGTFDPKGPFTWWISTIVRNEAVSYLRAKKNHRHLSIDAQDTEDSFSISDQLMDDEPSPLDTLLDDEASTRVCRAVAALSDEERNLIAGIFADEKSLSEMLANGELLYGSVPTASRRKTLLLRRLEKLLAGKI